MHELWFLYTALLLIEIYLPMVQWNVDVQFNFCDMLWTKLWWMDEQRTLVSIKISRQKSHTFIYVNCALCSKTSKFRPFWGQLVLCPLWLPQNYKSVKFDKKSHPHLQNENLCSGNGFSLQNLTPKTSLCSIMTQDYWYKMIEYIGHSKLVF